METNGGDYHQPPISMPPPLYPAQKPEECSHEAGKDQDCEYDILAGMKKIKQSNKAG